MGHIISPPRGDMACKRNWLTIMNVGVVRFYFYLQPTIESGKCSIIFSFDSNILPWRFTVVYKIQTSHPNRFVRNYSLELYYNTAIVWILLLSIHSTFITYTYNIYPTHMLETKSLELKALVICFLSLHLRLNLKRTHLSTLLSSVHNNNNIMTKSRDIS